MKRDPKELWPAVYSKYEESTGSRRWKRYGAVENDEFPPWISDDCFITVPEQKINLMKFLHDCFITVPEQKINLRKFLHEFLHESYQQSTSNDHLKSDDCFITVPEQKINLRKFLHEFLHESYQQSTSNDHLKLKYAIYYLVIRHPNKATRESDKKFTNPSEIQMYVGYATDGVRDRWDLHCHCVKEVLNATRSSRSLNQLMERCTMYQLVHAFIALAWLCQFDMALFVVKTFNNFEDMERYETSIIDQHAAINDHHGLNRQKGTTRQ